MEQITNNWEENLKKILENSIIIHKPTLEFLIKQKAREEIYLFIFYCYCSKLQKNYKKIWASNDFVRKNLKIRKQDLLKAKKKLTEWGIIETKPYQEKIENSNKKVIKKWFVEIKPFLNTENIINQIKGDKSKSPEVPSPEVPESRGWKREPQFLSNNNKFLSNNIKKDKNNSEFKNSPLKRKDFKVKPEIYKELIDAYQQYKGIKLSGAEFGEVRRAIKTMLYSGRTKENIIDFMKFCAETVEKMKEDPELKKNYAGLKIGLF